MNNYQYTLSSPFIPTPQHPAPIIIVDNQYESHSTPVKPLEVNEEVINIPNVVKKPTHSNTVPPFENNKTKPKPYNHSEDKNNPSDRNKYHTNPKTTHEKKQHYNPLFVPKNTPHFSPTNHSNHETGFKSHLNHPQSTETNSVWVRSDQGQPNFDKNNNPKHFDKKQQQQQQQQHDNKYQDPTKPPARIPHPLVNQLKSTNQLSSHFVIDNLFVKPILSPQLWPSTNQIISSHYSPNPTCCCRNPHLSRVNITADSSPQSPSNHSSSTHSLPQPTNNLFQSRICCIASILRHGLVEIYTFIHLNTKLIAIPFFCCHIPAPPGIENLAIHMWSDPYNFSPQTSDPDRLNTSLKHQITNPNPLNKKPQNTHNLFHIRAVLALGGSSGLWLYSLLQPPEHLSENHPISSLFYPLIPYQQQHLCRRYNISSLSFAPQLSRLLPCQYILNIESLRPQRDTSILHVQTIDGLLIQIALQPDRTWVELHFLDIISNEFSKALGVNPADHHLVDKVKSLNLPKITSQKSKTTQNLGYYFNQSTPQWPLFAKQVQQCLAKIRETCRNSPTSTNITTPPQKTLFFDSKKIHSSPLFPVWLSIYSTIAQSSTKTPHNGRAIPRCGGNNSFGSVCFEEEDLNWSSPLTLSILPSHWTLQPSYNRQNIDKRYSILVVYPTHIVFLIDFYQLQSTFKNEIVEELNHLSQTNQTNSSNILPLLLASNISSFFNPTLNSKHITPKIEIYPFRSTFANNPKFNDSNLCPLISHKQTSPIKILTMEIPISDSGNVTRKPKLCIQIDACVDNFQNCQIVCICDQRELSETRRELFQIFSFIKS